MDNYWRTRITVEVLSVGKKPPDFGTLAQVHYAITDGDCSGQWDEEHEQLDRAAFRSACEAQGSDPEFFFFSDDKVRVYLHQDDVDRHGEECGCGICDGVGRAFGVALLNIATGEVEARKYGPTWEAAEDCARATAEEYGWETLAPHSDWTEEELVDLPPDALAHLVRELKRDEARTINEVGRDAQCAYVLWGDAIRVRQGDGKVEPNGPASVEVT